MARGRHHQGAAARLTRGILAATFAIVAVAIPPSLAGAATANYGDKAQFLAQTGATSATGALPNLGAAGAVVKLGSVTFDTNPNTTCPGCSLQVGPSWTDLLPGNEIAVNGDESFDVTTASPVTAFGFDFVEPTDPAQCNVPTCVDSTFSLTLKRGATTVGSFNFNAPDDVAAFAGVKSDSPFDKVEIREIAGGIDNEFFGQFYTATPQQPPPPAPAPVVTAVEAVRPPATGRATVLNAVISGRTDRLEWNLRGDSRPEVVSSGAQTSLRFRPLPGINTVTVRAVGPDGAGPAMTTKVTGPPPPVGVIGRFAARLLDEPAVFAAGPLAGMVEVRDPRKCIDLYIGQPTRIRAGGLDVVGSCISPIDALSDIPQRERGILDSLPIKRTIKGGVVNLIGKALDVSDAYITYRGVNVNGVSLNPSEGAAIVIFPQLEAIASSSAKLQVGKLDLSKPREFVIDTGAVSGGAIPLGSFPRLPSSTLKAIGKLSFVGDVDVKLLPTNGATPGAAQVTAKLRLPPVFEDAGVGAEGKVILRATAAEGLILDHVRVGPIRAQLGGLRLAGLQLAYTAADKRWMGGATACVPTGYCLDMSPPNGSITFVNGALHSAGASLTFDPGIPIFPKVELERLGFFVGLDPTRFVGSGRLTVLKILAIDGRLLMAFPSERTPFILNADEVGGGFPAHFYGRQHTGTTVGVNAEAFLKLPAFKEIRLANAYVLYEYPGYVALGGGVDVGLGPVSISGGVNGEFNFGNGRFNLGGHVRACLGVCAGAAVIVSSRGAGACLNVDLGIGEVNIGGGMTFNPTRPRFWLVDGCRWSVFQERNVLGSQAGTRVVRVERGDPSQVIELHGAGGAPRIKLTAPDGQSLESPSGTGFVHRRGALRIYRSEQYETTVIGLQDPEPGAYEIETLTGSPAVTKFAQASDQPRAKVTARVTGSGARRALSYDVRRRTAQRVTFTEVMANGLARPIGTVNGGGRGKLRFSSAPGYGKRRVVAQFELAGMPAEELTVARFSPQSPKLGRPARVRVQRVGTSLRVSWRRVPGAARYELATTPTNGAQRSVRTRESRATVKGIARSASGHVSVRAVAPLRTGRPASAGFRATAPRKTRFGPLPRCRVGRKLVCS